MNAPTRQTGLSMVGFLFVAAVLILVVVCRLAGDAGVHRVLLGEERPREVAARGEEPRHAARGSPCIRPDQGRRLHHVRRHPATSRSPRMATPSTPTRGLEPEAAPRQQRLAADRVRGLGLALTVEPARDADAAARRPPRPRVPSPGAARPGADPPQSFGQPQRAPRVRRRRGAQLRGRPDPLREASGHTRGRPLARPRQPRQRRRARTARSRARSGGRAEARRGRAARAAPPVLRSWRTRWRRYSAPSSSTAASRRRAPSSSASTATSSRDSTRRRGARTRRPSCRNGCRRAVFRCRPTSWSRSPARRTRRPSTSSAAFPRSPSSPRATGRAAARRSRRPRPRRWPGFPREPPRERRRIPLRPRRHRRPAQRRQVDAAQPAGRREDQHHLAQGADHPPPRHRHPHHPRHAVHLRRHAGVPDGVSLPPQRADESCRDRQPGRRRCGGAGHRGGTDAGGGPGRDRAAAARRARDRRAEQDRPDARQGRLAAADGRPRRRISVRGDRAGVGRARAGAGTAARRRARAAARGVPRVRGGRRHRPRRALPRRGVHPREDLPPSRRRDPLLDDGGHRRLPARRRPAADPRHRLRRPRCASRDPARRGRVDG